MKPTDAGNPPRGRNAAPGHTTYVAGRASGLVTISGATLALTPEGKPYARLVASAFDEHSALNVQRFSRAV